MTELEKKDWIADLMYELVQDLNRWDKEEIVTVCKKIVAVCNLSAKPYNTKPILLFLCSIYQHHSHNINI